MPEVTLQQMLSAREERSIQQIRLIREYGKPVISYSLNIAGPIKDSPLIKRAYFYGKKQLCARLRAANVQIVFSQEKLAETGCELMLSAGKDAFGIKKICMEIEDADPMGRLFDMDVICPGAARGSKIDRSTLDAKERCCIVCGKPGRECASRRIHSIEELQTATRSIIQKHFRNADLQTMASLATKALLDEVCTTPKPGLVDRNNSGSHNDMDIFTFMKSISVLADYWKECVRTGMETTANEPAQTFARLRRLGMAAERDMYAATGGVNTHKGAIFSLGTVCGAAGRLWSAAEPERDPAKILAECAAMTKQAVEEDLLQISRMQSPGTHGEALYLSRKLPGVRGEMAAGFPSVRNIALPAFKKALAAGADYNDAGVAALLCLIADGTDNNMIVRGGMDEAKAAAVQAAALMKGRAVPDMDAVLSLDKLFISRNLSPGGCADLLAVTYFLYDWENEV